jgi:hypothetical protein
MAFQLVTCRRSPPLALAVHMLIGCASPSTLMSWNFPLRFELKAIRAPSGDQAGRHAAPGPLGKGLVALPSRAGAMKSCQSSSRPPTSTDSL